jgi:hypothetical protein
VIQQADNLVVGVTQDTQLSHLHFHPLKAAVKAEENMVLAVTEELKKTSCS